MNHVSRFALGLSSFVALAAIACSGAPDTAPIASSKKAASPSDDSTNTPSSGGKTPSATSAPGPSSPTTPAPSTPLSDTSACGKKTDAQACGDCCLAGSPNALAAADMAEGDCICAAAACQTACAASICATADNMNIPTDACNTCLDAHGQECRAKFDALCNADAACKAADACLTTQCDPLDKMTGGSSGGSSGGMRDEAASRAAAFSARMMARSADRQ